MKKLATQLLLGSIALATTVGVGSPAQAFTVYFGEDLGLGEGTRLPSTPNADNARNDFLSNLVGAGTETFEGFATGSTPPLSVNFVGAGTATLTGGGSIAEVTSGTNGFGRYPTSGIKYFETSSNNFTINFSDPIAAFGFKGIDIGDFSGQVQLTTSGGTTQTFTVPTTINGRGGSVAFFGIIAEASELFTSISFSNTNAGTDVFGFDDMTIGSLEQVKSTPEPASLIGLLGLGAFGVTTLRKRKAAVKA